MSRPSRRRFPAPAALFAALALASGGAAAGDLDCSVHSDYEISIDDDALRFDAPDGGPLRIELRDGRLFVDGTAIRLSEKDAERFAKMAREMHALAPEVLAIALEALDIAFDALSEVADSLLDDADTTRARLAEAHTRIAAELRAAPIGHLDDERLDHAVEGAVAELVPALVGEIVRSALTAAFSGDTARAEALEARAEQLERDIEARIAPRAKVLADRARVVCDRFADIDALEGEVEYRMPDGRRLELLRSGPE